MFGQEALNRAWSTLSPSGEWVGSTTRWQLSSKRRVLARRLNVAWLAVEGAATRQLAICLGSDESSGVTAADFAIDTGATAW